MHNANLARALTEGLGLDRPPVALAFVEAPPTAVTIAQAPAPSACTFWRRGEQGVFYAPARAHEECPVGMLTMGFPLDAAGQAGAQDLVGTMVSLDYFGTDEVAHLPSVKGEHAGIVYGPLADLPVLADVVLLVVSPHQAMLLSEAGGSAALGEVPLLATMGRPACAAIPRAVAAGQPTLSLGCIGARTYADIPEDRALVVVPAARLEAIVERLQALVRANSTLAQYHAAKRRDVEARTT